MTSPSRISLDWSGNNGSPRAAVGDPKPCIHCGQPAFCRHPVSGKPCHKVCEEAALTANAQAAGGAS